MGGLWEGGRVDGAQPAIVSHSFQTAEESIMSWFQKQLIWNTKVRATPLPCPPSPQTPHSVFPPLSPQHYSGGGQGLQMPIGIPIALGVLALLALLALACNCLKEVPAPRSPVPSELLLRLPLAFLMALCACRPGNPRGSPAARGGGTLTVDMISSSSPFEAQMKSSWEPPLQNPPHPSCLPPQPPEGGGWSVCLPPSKQVFKNNPFMWTV